MTGAEVTLPVIVLQGREDGPIVWLSAAIHGDEVVGVEVIRRVLMGLDPKRMAGTVVAVPVVNVHGFMNGDRYLPDRRDLNRSFPGSPRGSLASRIAHLLMTEIVVKCDVGIDLHSGSDQRSNLPHIRADLDDPPTRHLARVFGTPVVYHAGLRDGSLRSAATETGARVLLFEGGEANRFDEWAIEAGHLGVRRVLAELGVVADPGVAGDDPAPLECRRSTWVRANRSGILHLDCELGERIEEADRLGLLADAFGKRLATVKAPVSGVVIGRTERPLVNRGDALIHIASV